MPESHSTEVLLFNLESAENMSTKLRIWIIIPGEPAVFHPDAADRKPMRMALLARTLARRGHEVVWWTGAFQHETKNHLEPANQLIKTREPGVSLYLLPSPGYQKNISYARFRDYARLTRNWRQAAATMPPPDIIVASWPPVDLAHATVLYGKEHGVPVILDARDMWPDVIYERLKQKLHLSFMPRFLWNYERMTRQAFRLATGIIGITQGFMRWGLAKAGREQRSSDGVFFLSSPPLKQLDELEQKEAEAFWHSLGVANDGGKIIFSWVGTLTDIITTRNLLAAMARLPADVTKRAQFVICGKGALESQVAELASQHKHIIYAGYVSRARLAWLLPRCDYGLLVYDRTPDFQASLPNKINEYLGAGAHILTTLTGEVKRTLGPRGVVHFTEPDTASQMAAIVQLAKKGKLSSDERKRALGCYADLFDPDMVYNAMADHIQAVAGNTEGTQKEDVQSEMT